MKKEKRKKKKEKRKKEKGKQALTKFEDFL